jgi:hypothetical protein
MKPKAVSPQETPSTREPGQTNGADRRPAEVVDLLGKVQRHLQEGEPKKALDLIARAKLTSPWVTNALGVCQLRLARAQMAVDVFRGLVLAAGGVILRRDVPAAFKTNFATDLLADANMAGCLRVLEEIRDEQNPAVQRLRGSLQRWQESLTFWQKLNWCMGGLPNLPLILDYPLGDLE